MSFEAYLSALSITFDDFPKPYADALKHSVIRWEEVSYNHSTFPTFRDASPDSIPPIVHFIWYHDLYNAASTTDPAVSQIPHHGSHAPARCRWFNPDFEIKTWNATFARDFLTEHYAWILPIYDNYPYPIQQVDVLKYFVLYHHGGVYMDLDVACRRALDPLLVMPAWFAKAKPLGVNNDVMAARPGHPVMKAMTESLERRARWMGSEWITVFWSTGPKFVSDVLKEWVERHPEWRYRRGKVKAADRDPDAFYILSELFYCQDPGHTFFGHSPGGTWYGDDAKAVLWLLNRPWALALLMGMPVMAIAIVVLRKRRPRVVKTTKW